jgi:hypothetical protein
MDTGCPGRYFPHCANGSPSVAQSATPSRNPKLMSKDAASRCFLNLTGFNRCVFFLYVPVSWSAHLLKVWMPNIVRLSDLSEFACLIVSVSQFLPFSATFSAQCQQSSQCLAGPRPQIYWDVPCSNPDHTREHRKGSKRYSNITKQVQTCPNHIKSCQIISNISNEFKYFKWKGSSQIVLLPRLDKEMMK